MSSIFLQVLFMLIKKKSYVLHKSERKTKIALIESRKLYLRQVCDLDLALSVGQYIWGLLCKYWILICAAMMLIISLQEVVIYRIIYMIFFLLFVLTFQVSDLMTLTFE